MKLQKTILITLLLIMSFMGSASAELAEDFSFKDIYGKTHKLSDYRGKWVLANYWGTYCSPCLEEIPDLVDFTDNHKGDAVILGLDAGGTDIKDLREFAREYDMNYVVAPVQESTINALGILMVIPTTYIISPKGEMVEKILGIIDLESVERRMAAYKKEAEQSTENDSSSDDILDF